MVLRKFYVQAGELIGGTGGTGVGASSPVPGNYLLALNDPELFWFTRHGSFPPFGIQAYIWNHIGLGTPSAPNPQFDQYYGATLLQPNGHTQGSNQFNEGGAYPSAWFGPEVSFLQRAMAGREGDATFYTKFNTSKNPVLGAHTTNGKLIGSIVDGGGGTTQINTIATHGKAPSSTFIVWLYGIQNGQPNLRGKHVATAHATDPRAFTIPVAYTSSEGQNIGGVAAFTQLDITALTPQGGNVLRVTFSQTIPTEWVTGAPIWLSGISGTATNLNARWNNTTRIDNNNVDIDLGVAPSVGGWASNGYAFWKGAWMDVFSGEAGGHLYWDRLFSVIDANIAWLATNLPSATIQCDGFFFTIGYNDAGGTSLITSPDIRTEFRQQLAEFIDRARTAIASRMTVAGGQVAADVPFVNVVFGPDPTPSSGDPTTTVSGYKVLNHAAIREANRLATGDVGPKSATVEIGDLPHSTGGIFYSGDGWVEMGYRQWRALQKATAGASPGTLGAPVYFLMGQSQTAGPVQRFAPFYGEDPDFDGSHYDPNTLQVKPGRERLAFILNFGTGNFEEYTTTIGVAIPGNSNTLPKASSVSGGVGPEMTLILELRKRHPEGVYLIKVAMPSAALQPVPTLPTFDPAAGDLAVDIETGWQLALDWFRDNNLIPDVRGAFFDQGESDTAEPYASSYGQALTEFIAWFRGKFTTTTSSRSPMPFVIGKLQKHARIAFPVSGVDKVRAAQEAVRAALVNVAIADMDGLPIGDDDVHRTYRALLAAGSRLNDALDDTTLVTDGPELDEGANINPELSASTVGPNPGSPQLATLPESEPVALAATATSSDILAGVDDALTAFLTNGAIQSYSVNGRTVTRANLKDLLELRRAMKSETAAAYEGGSINYFRRGAI